MYEMVLEIIRENYAVDDWEGNLDSLIIKTDAPVEVIKFALNESNYSGIVSKKDGVATITDIEEL